ncbi:calpain-A [Lingula anatina]|uniref:Calpain-A n=1 Tax=Lingula anatina TaxID=7574 RepID=A0A1S3I126_LINAN|nr:calpain-A [Lingula anatina]|eukprot:XP_013391531.1 calpain-A [Lingula anatina]
MGGALSLEKAEESELLAGRSRVNRLERTSLQQKIDQSKTGQSCHGFRIIYKYAFILLLPRLPLGWRWLVGRLIETGRFGEVNLPRHAACVAVSPAVMLDNMPSASTFTTLEARCLNDGSLYEDETFPAAIESINPDGNVPIREADITWKRPKEICDNPVFIQENATSFNLYQGKSDSCCFAAAAALLATKRLLFKSVVPPDQNFGGNYTGIFHFYLWRYGKWREVIIDDRLPLGKDKKLLFCQNQGNPEEFWCALLEKAYAKLCGSYSAISSLFARDIMVDFTGGFPESYNIKKKAKLPNNLFDLLRKCGSKAAILQCGIWPDKGETIPMSLPTGLYTGHAYSVTSMKQIQVNGTPTRLVRLNNPQGQTGWKGAWGETSKEWQAFTLVDKESQGVRCNDNEFWMTFDDWLKNFEILDIIHMRNKEEEVVWQSALHYGEWVHGVTAGGGGSNPAQKELYFTNPQYQMTIRLRDADEHSTICTCLLSLMQILPPQRDLFLGSKPSSHLIFFNVYQIKDGVAEPFNEDNYSERASAVYQLQTNVVQREVTCRLRLEPGVYCLIPTTQKTNQEADFLLRIWTEKEIHSCLVDETTGPYQPKVSTSIPLDGEDSSVPENYLGLSKDVFFKYGGLEGAVDGRDLRVLINHLFRKDLGDSGGFTVEPCRSLLSMFDVDSVGYLNFDQTSKLWQLIRRWRAVFKRYDTSRSGLIESFEVRKLFRDIGFRLNTPTVTVIIRKYGGKQENINFEDFVLCAARVHTLYSSYKKYSKRGLGDDARLNMEQWMQVGMTQ